MLEDWAVDAIVAAVVSVCRLCIGVAGLVAAAVVVVDRLVDCRHRWARCPLRWDPLRASRNRFAALGDWTAGLKESEKKN